MSLFRLDSFFLGISPHDLLSFLLTPGLAVSCTYMAMSTRLPEPGGTTHAYILPVLFPYLLLDCLLTVSPLSNLLPVSIIVCFVSCSV